MRDSKYQKHFFDLGGVKVLSEVMSELAYILLKSAALSLSILLAKKLCTVSKCQFIFLSRVLVPRNCLSHVVLPVCWRQVSGSGEGIGRIVKE